MTVDTSIAPSQFYAKRWAIYSALGEPRIKLEAWRLSVRGLVEELQRLPQVKLTRDVHCVTAWSIKDVIWEGVAFRELAKLAKVKAVAKWVMFHCADRYTAPVPLEDAMVEDGGTTIFQSSRAFPRVLSSLIYTLGRAPSGLPKSNSWKNTETGTGSHAHTTNAEMSGRRNVSRPIDDDDEDCREEYEEFSSC